MNPVKRQFLFHFFLLIIILPIPIHPPVVESIGRDNARIIHPDRGDLIKTPNQFNVKVEIDHFDYSSHYWVAIAKPTGHTQMWDRVLSLHQALRVAHDDDRKTEIDALIDLWEIDYFWPKFWVTKTPSKHRISHPCKNPLENIEPQPMILLVLKVDDALHNRFREWFAAAKEDNSRPGLSPSELNKKMVLARCEIFFP